MPRRFRLRETHFALAQVLARGNGDATLLGIVDGTIEVVDYTIVLYHIAFVGEQLVVGLRGDDEVWSVPVLPMDEITADGKGVVGAVLPRRVEG